MPERRRPRASGLEVAILGKGRAGSAFGRALAERGVGVRTWSRASRRSLGETALGADLVLFCVRDDAIEAVARDLAREARRASKPPVALHLSGYHGDRPLRALRAKGWPVGSIHPLVPLIGRSSSSDLEGAWFATSARGRAAKLARGLVRILGGKELRLPPGDARKHAWHLACALVANGAVALFDAGLERAGPKAAPALASMLGIVARRLEKGPRSALTGPVARGETEVVAGHLALLRRAPEDAALYRLLSKRLLGLSPLGARERRAMSRLLG